MESRQATAPKPEIGALTNAQDARDRFHVDGSRPISTDNRLIWVKLCPDFWKLELGAFQ